MTSQDSAQPDESAGYGLAEIFEALRNDFVAAQRQLVNADREPIMQLGETEVELAFTVEHAGKGKGGVNLKVFGVGFEAGGEKGTTRAAVHRLMVKLSPAGIIDVLDAEEE
jgi:Trypsin-co-occurring domain 2